LPFLKEDGVMQALFSPGSLLTVLGAVLTVIGSVAYATDAPNLSLPTIFYGIPIFLGGVGPEVGGVTTAPEDYAG
jgi:hypothetical protein